MCILLDAFTSPCVKTNWTLELGVVSGIEKFLLPRVASKLSWCCCMSVLIPRIVLGHNHLSDWNISHAITLDPTSLEAMVDFFHYYKL